MSVWGRVVSQGLFFDEAYGFYPGQVLIGPAKVFSNVQWLSGVKPVLSRKSKFRVVVEEVNSELVPPSCGGDAGGRRSRSCLVLVCVLGSGEGG